MINLSKPEVGTLVDSLSDAIKNQIDKADPFLFHDRIRSMYSWSHVADKTLSIYDKVQSMPRLSLLNRLERYMTSGVVSGYVGCLVAVTVHFIYMIISWWIPIESIDVVPDLLSNDSIICIKTTQTNTKQEQAPLIHKSPRY